MFQLMEDNEMALADAPKNILETIIRIILGFDKQANNITHYSLNGGANKMQLPANCTHNVHRAGLNLHVDVNLNVEGARNYKIIGIRNLISPVIENTATINGEDCPGGIYLHNVTSLDELAKDREITLTYGVRYPKENQDILFYATYKIS